MRDAELKEKRVWKPWISWQHDKVEGYLEAQAAKGWHLNRVEGFVWRLHFVKGSPQQVCFVLDFQKQPHDNYCEGLQQNGWERVHASSGWHLWKKRYTKQRPQPSLDRSKLIAHNERLLQVTVAIMLLNLPLYRYLQTSLGTLNASPDNFISSFLSSFIMGLYTLVVVILFVNIIKLLQFNKLLKGEGGIKS